MRIFNYIGRKGEDYAVQFLKKKKYLILERNYRKSYAEIDIIALDPKKETLIFIEVKTRTSTAYGTPLESIRFYKLRPVIKTAQFYANLHKELPQSLRIDAISVLLSPTGGEVVSIQHVENITM